MRRSPPQTTSIYRSLAPLLHALLCFTLPLLSVACVEGNLVISEVSFPQISSDAEGPYLVSVRTSGAVDELRAEWSREAPEGSSEAALLDSTINQQGMTLATFDGEVWTVRLPGGALVADYHFSLTASNTSKSARYPAEGTVSFRVRSLSGRCSSDAQCLTGEVCHRGEGYCFSPPELCTRDVHCPRDQFCNLETGACRFYDTGCEEDRDCAAGYLCEEGSCTQPCDGLCGQGYICDGVNCVAPPCEGSSDCPPELPLCQDGLCAPALSTCTPECGLNEVCVSGSCEPAPCGSSGPCSSGSICVEGQCVGCQADGQCGAGWRCDLDSNRCVEGARAQLCAPCHEAIDGEIGCGDTLTCVNTYPGCRQRCTNDQDCSDGYCEMGGCLSFAWESCEGEQCWSDQDCSPDQTCVAGFCERGQRCSADADCSSDMRCGDQGLCTLRAPCDRSWDQRCGPGEVCVGGRCEVAREPLPSLCQPCINDRDCGPQQVCGFFYAGNAICASLCDTTCDGDDYCYAVSELTSVCAPLNGCGGNMECGRDEWEPNESPNEAGYLYVERGSYYEGWVCMFEEDWFYIENPNNLPLSLFANSEGLSFELYNSDFEPVRLLQDEVISGVTLPPEATWMRVSSRLSVDSMYWMFVDDAVCEDDIFEPNDELWSAYPIGDGAWINAELCLGDVDWYEVYPNRRNRQIEVSFYRSSPSFRISYFGLYDSEGDLLTDVITDSREFTLSHFQEERAPVFVQLQCYDGCEETDDYELSVEIFRP